MEVIGYARVSTKEQNLDLQIDALKEAKCTKIFTEKISATKERPELDNALKYLRKGDVLVIWKLDRLGRSLKQLINILENLKDKGVEFRSIKDGIDTRTPMGRLQFGIFASLAEYEREIIVERTLAGLQSAKERGKVGGRPKGLNAEAKKKAKIAKNLYADKDIKVEDICKTLNINSKATLYRYLEYENVKIDRKNV
ncbi:MULTISPECIES: recombinase family protein [Capnocytophaga]|uniref:Resolvase/invertase-type recombinase catalytic domain-containing protein n=1 Tax=Capnocytophaga canis TaxID=1848903 RepID=A0A0B7ISV4_9FLAO|nr:MULTISPECIES: recombinase family protein [Capnocytophaga]GJQ04037.1 resolvase [Capnocytophaga canimorsus]CEN53048.1 conserved hypothetical protein [Capnocytophaga canis]